jgi:hypothetical protein
MPGRALIPFEILSPWGKVLLEAKGRVEAERGKLLHAELTYAQPVWGFGAVLSMMIWGDPLRVDRIRDGRDGLSRMARGVVAASRLWS